MRGQKTHNTKQNGQLVQKGADAFVSASSARRYVRRPRAASRRTWGPRSPKLHGRPRGAGVADASGDCRSPFRSKKIDSFEVTAREILRFRGLCFPRSTKMFFAGARFTHSVQRSCTGATIAAWPPGEGGPRPVIHDHRRGGDKAFVRDRQFLTFPRCAQHSTFSCVPGVITMAPRSMAGATTTGRCCCIGLQRGKGNRRPNAGGRIAKDIRLRWRGRPANKIWFGAGAYCNVLGWRLSKKKGWLRPPGTPAKEIGKFTFLAAQCGEGQWSNKIRAGPPPASHDDFALNGDVFEGVLLNGGRTRSGGFVGRYSGPVYGPF